MPFRRGKFGRGHLLARGIPHQQGFVRFLMFQASRKEKGRPGLRPTDLPRPMGSIKNIKKHRVRGDPPSPGSGLPKVQSQLLGQRP